MGVGSQFQAGAALNAPAALSVTIGGRGCPLYLYARDFWRSKETGAISVHRFGRRWRIAISVELGPQSHLRLMAWGSTLAAAEFELDQQLEPLRGLFGQIPRNPVALTTDSSAPAPAE